MYDASGIRSYQQTTITSVGPERLITMLYEGIFSRLDRAEQAIADGDIARRARNVNRALAIVAELKHSLDHDVAPELCRSLTSLYDFAAGELMQVHLDADPVHLARVRRVLTPLYQAWRAIPEGTAERAREERPAPGAEPAGGGTEDGPAGTAGRRTRELCVAV